MIFGHHHSDDTRADLKDDNGTAKLSNFFGFQLLHTHKKSIIKSWNVRRGSTAI